MRLNLDTDEPPELFTPTPGGGGHPKVSPAGDIVACVSGTTPFPIGALRVVAFPSPGAPVQVSATPVFCLEFIWIDAGELA